MKKQKGYTLIEVIIVIAIMAVLATMSFITLGVIRQAKSNAAATTLENQLSSLWMKTKTISQAREQTTPSSTDSNAKYPLCLKIEKKTTGTRSEIGTYSLILGYNEGGTFTEKTAGVVEATIPNVISISYTPTDTSQQAAVGGIDYTDNFLIQFNKADGSVQYGAGSYELVMDGRTVFTVVLDASTGKHYIK